MESLRHGLSIGIERVDNEIFLSMKARGTLTHQDYQIITPMIESALDEVKNPKINVYFDCTELTGWDAHGAWDDFKIGLKYGNKFERIALVGHKKWQEYAAKIGTWFISGEAKFFENAEEAVAWLRHQ